MIDFTELPEDGTAFEQLLREMFLRYDMNVHWTGKGPDGGRDLVVVEELAGRIHRTERKWLVQCKHNAHSGKAVGRNDVGSVTDDCNQIGASGYLLACSTVASSAVVTKLDEISANSQLQTVIWDHVEIERRLSDPRLFALAQLFFPKSAVARKWRLYNDGLPHKWTGNYRGCFVILLCRVGGEPPPLSSCGVIVDGLLAMRRKKPGEYWWNQEDVRPRLLFWDDKHSHFHVYADYVLPNGDDAPLLSPSDFANQLQDGYAREVKGEYVPPCHYFVAARKADKAGDRYHKDDPTYYERYENGIPRRCTSLADLVEYGDRWW